MHSSSVLLAVGAAASVQAFDLEALRLKSTAVYVNSADVRTTSKLRHLKRETYVETATDLVKQTVPDAAFKISEDHYTGTNGISHVYVRQTIHDVEVDGAYFNINIDQEGHVLSYGNSFYTGNIPAESPLAKRDSIISPMEALDIVKATLELSIEVAADSETEPITDEEEAYTVNGVSGAEHTPRTKLVYLVKPDGDLALTWRVETEVDGTSYSSYVDVEAETSEVVAVQDHVDWFTYEVYPFPLNDPREGERIIVEDPLDSKASPFGWHSPPNGGNYETWGNNVEAGAWPVAQVLPATSPNGTFVYPYEPDSGEPFDTYMAGVTQAFYITNMLHDLYYLLGFTPAAGNYQSDNNGEGGAGSDPVRVLLQSLGGMNNGKFTQSTDGSPGTLTMYLFDKTDPMRDSAFDSGFLMHEYTHGMSDRMTGGPTTSGCLTAWEPDGMAEGWSDLFAAALTIKPDEDRDSATYGFAAWPLNNTNPPTARLRMYSTNMEINDFTYSSANGLTAVHQVGTVWATMLYEVLWNLIDKYGKNDNPRPDLVDGVPTDGKFLTLKLVTDAFAIQPCNPSIVQARDAIIDADVALTGGENACEIWSGFAKRGLGAGAVTTDPRVDNFDLPDGVC